MLKAAGRDVKRVRFNHAGLSLLGSHGTSTSRPHEGKRHEYALVHEWTKEIFASTQLKATSNVRWFDRRQAYCADRIDKGLADALMLKRAQCTFVLAQSPTR